MPVVCFLQFYSFCLSLVSPLPCSLPEHLRFPVSCRYSDYESILPAAFLSPCGNRLPSGCNIPDIDGSLRSP